MAITTLADAFFQVAVFVAVTLYVYHKIVAKLPQLELQYLRAKSPALEVIFASILGALPGCGGAIIVVTQYTQRQASFGSLVAVLTSTMGDAAFLLLATRPLDGLLIITLGIAVGFICGLVVNTLPEPEFASKQLSSDYKATSHKQNYFHRVAYHIWQLMLAPCLIVSLLLAANIDLGPFTQFATIFGCTMAFLGTLCWAFDNATTSTANAQNSDRIDTFTTVIKDTHFVSVWVIISFMLYELITMSMGFELANWFSDYAILAPLIAVLIGLVPGCGAQILVTTLYIQGVIPFSALAGNAISNDGDALFPAIALAPKAALLATCYSTMPALLVAYTLYWW
ncbi:putative manganese transporter [Pseudoalteromonas sp. T1lg23B]|uniref:putative manganese transporter n=1 Tax=Pseudoalteromonas sp. T1lg23B TaxID=2077097 RepID=UPI001F355D64|nr:putative manganese transporter [Pseudoalteromonas sp. T1lg23B]